FQGVVATFSDQNPGAPVTDFTTESGKVEINWGDGTTSTVVPTGLNQGAVDGKFLVSAPSSGHTYSQAGSKTLTLTVTDKGGATKSVSKVIQVVAPPITAGDPVSIADGAAGSALTDVVVGTFTSPDPSAVPANFSPT